MKKTNKVVGYVKPVFGLCLFMMLIYGAYTPNQKAEVQQIVCIKFKVGTTENDIKKHLSDFAQLRHDIPQIAAYTGGKTLGSNEYDVMHYVSFRTEDGPAVFNGHAKHKAFEAANQKQWDKVLVINADIER